VTVSFTPPLPAIVVPGVPVTFRPFEIGDLPLIAEASADSFIPKITSVPVVWSEQVGTDFSERQWTRDRTSEGWSLAIEVDGSVVGQIGLCLRNAHKGRVEIGYWIAESGRGNGCAAEAVRMLSAWAFANLDIDRSSLFVESRNEASIRTAVSAGYTREGILQAWERVQGETKDMLLFALVR
jgi:[ribosomal protein S5]-alanine N-acetyltransferase